MKQIVNKSKSLSPVNQPIMNLFNLIVSYPRQALKKYALHRVYLPLFSITAYLSS
jgi:hypothetical protein